MSTSKTCPHVAQGNKLYIKQHIIFVFHLLLMCSSMWQKLWQEQWRFLTRNLQSVLANAAEMLWEDGHAVSLGKTLCSKKPYLQGLIWLHRWGTSTQLAYCHISFLSLLWRSFIYFGSGICFASVSPSCFSLCCPTMAGWCSPSSYLCTRLLLVKWLHSWVFSAVHEM